MTYWTSQLFAIYDIGCLTIFEALRLRAYSLLSTKFTSRTIHSIVLNFCISKLSNTKTTQLVDLHRKQRMNLNPVIGRDKYTVYPNQCPSKLLKHNQPHGSGPNALSGGPKSTPDSNDHPSLLTRPLKLAKDTAQQTPSNACQWENPAEIISKPLSPQ